MRIPRILITAPASGTGKTLITCGILKAMMNRGYQVASFKCGPDYIDPMFHRSVLGIDSYNLDTFLCGKEGVREILCRHGKEKEISVIEGVMGYYDGLGGISTDASAYDIAQTTNTPSVLIVDCKGRSVSVIPEIQGFLNYQKNSQIKGVILNRLSPMLYGRMKQMIEEQLQIEVFGYFPVLQDCVIESRYLGLKRPEELENIQEQIRRLGEQAEHSIDIDGLIQLGWLTEDLPDAESLPDCNENAGARIRIGLAKDEAFCFMYQDNLELLEHLGARLVPFSPLHDDHLPEQLDGILLYGGYPELYAEPLSQNQILLTELREAVSSGMPCMAECGGFMYLMEAMEGADGKDYPMAGVLSGNSYRTESLRRFGYETLQNGKIFGEDVGQIPAHEFHYYDAKECGEAFLARKPLSERNWKCMVSTETLFAGYPHIHYLGNPKIASVYLETCRKYHQKEHEKNA